MACAITIGSACAIAAQTPDYVGEPLTPEHVGAESRMTRLLTEARALAARKEYPAAIRNYVFVFNHSRGVARMAVTRLSVVPVEVAALGAVFPAALDALREETRIRAGLILTNVAGTDEILEFIALNQALDQTARVLEMYDQLKSMGDRARDMRLRMRAVIAPELLEAGRYAELGDQLVAMTRALVAGMAELDAAAEFDVTADAVRASYHAARREYVIATGLRTAGALFQTQRVDHGKKLSERLIDFARTKDVASALVESARQAKHPELARGLIDHAARVLSAADAAALRGAAP